MKEKLNYKSAGVNIDEGNKLIQSIGQLVVQTARPGADTKLGGFGGIFDVAKLNYKDPLLVSATDGVGTKLKLATQLNKHTTIGQDLVAMCVNDILAQGAEPLFFLDYFATGKLNKTQAFDVISGIANACKQSNCALIGGETAEMPGMYKPQEYDLAGFVVGIVEREHLLPKKERIQAEDIVIGLQSSGLHSNGYSLVRKIIEMYNINLQESPPFESTYQTFGELLLEPTYLYTSTVLPLCKQQKIKAIAHITGGGLLENIPRVLPNHLSFELDYSTWEMPQVFTWLQQTAQLSDYELRRTFNCAIGMVLIVDQQKANTVLQACKQISYTVRTIGKIIHK